MAAVANTDLKEVLICQGLKIKQRIERNTFPRHEGLNVRKESRIDLAVKLCAEFLRLHLGAEVVAHGMTLPPRSIRLLPRFTLIVSLGQRRGRIKALGNSL